MAASDEFPRGLWLNSGTISGGATAILSYPAMPGIQWVLTDIQATSWIIATGGQTYVVSAQSATVIYMQLVVSVGVASGGPTMQTTESWSGQITLPPNTQLNVLFNAASTASIGELLRTRAYAI